MRWNHPRSYRSAIKASAIWASTFVGDRTYSIIPGSGLVSVFVNVQQRKSFLTDVSEAYQKRDFFRVNVTPHRISRRCLIRAIGPAVDTSMTAKPIVFYNGACSICRREIEHYRCLDRSETPALEFSDISAPEPALAGLALTQDDAKRRLHVLDAEGQLVMGIPAFAAVWDHLPRYRWLAKLTRLPVLRHLLPWVYEPIAFGLYHLDKRRQRRCAGSSRSRFSLS